MIVNQADILVVVVCGTPDNNSIRHAATYSRPAMTSLCTHPRMAALSVGLVFSETSIRQRYAGISRIEKLPGQAKAWNFHLPRLGPHGAVIKLRVRVQIIRHFETCTTDIYLHHDCAHVGLSTHAPVCFVSKKLVARPE